MSIPTVALVRPCNAIRFAVVWHKRIYGNKKI